MTVAAYFPKGVHSAPTSIDYDVASPLIQCHADKANAQVFEFSDGCEIVKVLAFDEREARSLAAPILFELTFGAQIDLGDDEPLRAFKQECEQELSLS